MKKILTITLLVLLTAGLFVACNADAVDELFEEIPVATPTFKAVYNTTDNANTLTFYYDAVDYSGDNITVYDNLPTAATQAFDWDYNGIRDNVNSVVIDSSVANYKGLTSTAYMFYEMYYAESISGAEYLDVSNVTDMSLMFLSYGSASTELNAVPNVSKWNTGKVTNMSSMFNSYGQASTELTAVPDVSKWDTSNVTNMSYMFQYYGYASESLEVVPNVSKWNTGKVTNMSSMFNCYGQASTVLNAVPDVSEWDTGKVTDMSYMFCNYGKTSAVLNFTLDLSKWGVARVMSYRDMFKDAGAIASTWSVTIPAKTGEQANETAKWYIGDGTDTNKYITPASGKAFKVAAPIVP